MCKKIQSEYYDNISDKIQGVYDRTYSKSDMPYLKKLSDDHKKIKKPSHDSKRRNGMEGFERDKLKEIYDDDQVKIYFELEPTCTQIPSGWKKSEKLVDFGK